MLTITELNNLKQKTLSNAGYIHIEPKVLRELVSVYEEQAAEDDDTFANYKEECWRINWAN